MSSEPTIEEQLAAQTEALASIGFGPARIVGSPFSLPIEVVECQVCGALVALTQTLDVPPEERPAVRHWRWHETQNTPAQPEG